MVHDVPDAESVLRRLPERLDREAVRGAVQENLSREQVLGAFLPVLVWGGPGGYGPFRARAILTGVRRKTNLSAPVDDAIRDQLLAGSERVQKDGALEAFRFMNNDGKIKYFGGAFFTKWLAFCSMTDSVDSEKVAPILDKRVRDWVAQHTSAMDRVSLSTTSSSSYQRYLELLDAWGAPHGRTRAQVELAIFDLTRDRPTEG